MAGSTKWCRPRCGRGADQIRDDSRVKGRIEAVLDTMRLMHANLSVQSAVSAVRRTEPLITRNIIVVEQGRYRVRERNVLRYTRDRSRNPFAAGLHPLIGSYQRLHGQLDDARPTPMARSCGTARFSHRWDEPLELTPRQKRCSTDSHSLHTAAAGFKVRDGSGGFARRFIAAKPSKKRSAQSPICLARACT